MDISKKYPGIPANLTSRMESCVKQVMATGKAKPNAIAICHNSIMGGKKVDEDSWKVTTVPNQITFNINLSDYWRNINSGTTFDGSEAITTGTYDTFIGEEMKDEDTEQSRSKEKTESESLKDKLSAEGGDKKSMTKKDEKKVEKQDEEEVVEDATDDSDEVEVKSDSAEESVEAKTDDAEESTEASVEESTADGAETVEEESKEAESADIEQAEDVNTLLKSVIAKIDKLVEKQDEESVTDNAEGDNDDSATTEGAANEAAPEGVPSNGTEEEASEDVSSEGAEVESDSTEEGEVAKSLGKVADSMEKLTKSVDDVSKQVSEIDERLTKIEEQPVPSKVESPVVVSKGGSSEQATGEKAQRLEEITKRLDELDQLKKNNLGKYQEAKAWEEAFNLIAERDYIKTTLG